MALTPKDIARMLDHSTLQPWLTEEDIRKGCEIALKYGTASVCARPCDVPILAKMLAGSEVKVCTVIGFPHGAHETAIKLAEAQLALAEGCEELDMVLNIGKLKGGDYEYVGREIRMICEAAHAAGAIVKVILETCFLTEEEKVTACHLSEQAGADFAGRLSASGAAAICRPARGGADVQLQWAGDSRVYLLDGAGLAQLTEDDTGGLDAMQRQSQDKAPTNVIRLNGDFSIHTARLTVNRPCLLFAATGGCFGQLSTPMEFEYLLLSTLPNAPNAESWEKNLAESIGKGAEDDYSLCGIALNAGSFDELKRQLAGRTSQLYRTYIRGLDACTAEEKLQLWEHYKAHYHRLLCRV